MEEIKIGDRVRLHGQNLTGVVATLHDDGNATITLDIGATLVAQIPMLEPADKPERNAEGRFVPGHARLPANPQNAEAKASARAIRQKMLTELAPYFSKVGTYIDQIPSPISKIGALSKLAPYVLPALSRVEFTDQTPRNLTIEQQLVEFTQKVRGEIRQS